MREEAHVAAVVELGRWQRDAEERVRRRMADGQLAEAFASESDPPVDPRRRAAC